MTFTHHILGESATITEWCRKHYGNKAKLTVQIVWNHSSSQNASLSVDGIARQYGEEVSLDNGEHVIDVTCNDSSARFNRFSFEDSSVDHSAYAYQTTLNVQGKTEISATFSTYWT